MFVLRKISGEGVEMNFSLGESYTIVSKNHNPKEFQTSFEKHFQNPDTESTEQVFGFVYYDSEAVIVLYRNQHNFIMNDRGDTFCNLKNY